MMDSGVFKSAWLSFSPAPHSLSGAASATVMAMAIAPPPKVTLDELLYQPRLF